MMDPNAAYGSVQETLHNLVSITRTMEQTFSAMTNNLQNMWNELDILQQQYSEVLDERDYVKKLMDVSDKQLGHMRNVIGPWVAEDSVLASDGYTYERQKLLDFLHDCSKTGKEPISEQDKSVLSSVLIPNRSLKTFLDRLIDLIGTSQTPFIPPDMGTEENERVGSSSGGGVDTSNMDSSNRNTNFVPYEKFTQGGNFAIDQEIWYGYLGEDVNCTTIPMRAMNAVSNKNRNRNNDNNMYATMKSAIAATDSTSNMTKIHTNNNNNNSNVMAAGNNNNNNNNNGNGRRMGMRNFVADVNGSSNGTNGVTSNQRQFNTSTTEQAADQHPGEQRLHPCLRVYGHCNYRQNCTYAKYPYDACLSYLKGKCRFNKACHELHVDFIKPQPSRGSSNPRQETKLTAATENGGVTDGNNTSNTNTNNNNNNSSGGFDNAAAV